MKILYLLLVTILLAGCSTTVPVTQKFPQVPDNLLKQCKPLKQLDKETDLLVLTKVVVENYTEYYICGETVNGWIAWYTKQQQLYKELK